MEYYSLNEVARLLEEDVLLTCSVTLRVDVTMEKPRSYIREEDGTRRVVLEKDWLVSLSLPASSESESHPVFSDGEKQLIGDLQYLGRETLTISLKEALEALGIDRDARIWAVKQAS